MVVVQFNSVFKNNCYYYFFKDKILNYSRDWL